MNIDDTGNNNKLIIIMKIIIIIKTIIITIILIITIIIIIIVIIIMIMIKNAYISILPISPRGSRIAHLSPKEDWNFPGKNC